MFKIRKFKGKHCSIHFNLDDVIETCGCSRQYLYKYYPGVQIPYMSLPELYDFITMVRANRKRKSKNSSPSLG